MVKRLSLMLAALGMLLPVAVSALGLGEIRLSSALNEPLRAEIPLISVSADEADLLSVRLAPREQYEQAGIEQVPELRQLRFETVTGANGKPAISVTTRDAVAEPFLNFLIEVNWPSGRMVREYTVLLDPPTLMRGAPPVSQLPAVSTPAAARPPSVSATSTGSFSGGEYGPVASGETLWVIAQAVRPDASLTIPQVMLALQQANPEAFIRNNINLLKAGVVLRVPSRDEMATLAAEEARASARAQAAEWEAYRGRAAERVTAAPRTEIAAPAAPDTSTERSARLELVVPEKQPETAPSAAPEGAGAPGGSDELAELRRQLDLATEEAEARRLQNEELNGQIRELEEQVAALEKLIEFNVDEMAALQQNLQAQEAMGEGAAPTAEAMPTMQPAEGEQAPMMAPPEGAATMGEVAAGTAPADGEGASTPAVVEQPGDEVAKAEHADEKAVAAGHEGEQAAEAEHGHAAESEAAHGHSEDVKHAAAAPPPPPAPEPGLLEDPVLLGGAAVILLALVGVLVAKRRGAGKVESGSESEPASEAEFEAAPADVAALAGAAAAVRTEPEPSIAVQHEEDDEAGFDAGETTGRSVLDQFAPEGVAGQDEGGEDPLEQADVFLAYGRNEQAEKVLRNLLAREPARVDAMVKLLEIYSDSQDRASFDRQLEDLHEALAGEGGPHWQRATELARGISPNHHLLGGAVAAVTTQVDDAADQELSLDQLDDEELDIDLDFEPVFGDESETEDGEPLDITREFSGDELGNLAEEGAMDVALAGEVDDAKEAQPIDLEDDEGDEEQRLGGGFDLEGDIEALATTGELTEDDLADLDLGLAEQDETTAKASADEAATEEGEVFDLDLDLGMEGDDQTPPGGRADEQERERPAAEGMLDSGESLASDELGELDATLDGDEAFDFDLGDDMVATKLELASTYLDMDDHEGARSILEEVLAEGTEEQKSKAQELLANLPG